jgi:GT2 family glycosyltransferase
MYGPPESAAARVTSQKTVTASANGESQPATEIESARGQSHSIGEIIALIATFNRKELLCKVLEATLSQTEPPDRIFIFDNGSTDGTKENLQSTGYLAHPRISYFSASSNSGPAGAYDHLFRLAWKAGCDWVWFLDDDVIPAPDALQELKAAFAENFSRPEDVGLLSSSIITSDGLANNVPEIDMRCAAGREPEWADLLSRGLVRIRWSTFCSYLLPRSTLAKVGSVNPDFYSAGVDIDFTLRITDAAPAYMVGTSKVTHLRKASGTYSILTETDPVRMKSFFRYHYRNNIYIRRKYYSSLRAYLYIGKTLLEAIGALKTGQYRWLRVRMIFEGILSGLFYNPRESDLSLNEREKTQESRERALSHAPHSTPQLG